MPLIESNPSKVYLQILGILSFVPDFIVCIKEQTWGRLLLEVIFPTILLMAMIICKKIKKSERIKVLVSIAVFILLSFSIVAKLFYSIKIGFQEVLEKLIFSFPVLSFIFLNLKFKESRTFLLLILQLLLSLILLKIDDFQNQNFLILIIGCSMCFFFIQIISTFDIYHLFVPAKVKVEIPLCKNEFVIDYKGNLTYFKTNNYIQNALKTFDTQTYLHFKRNKLNPKFSSLNSIIESLDSSNFEIAITNSEIYVFSKLLGKENQNKILVQFFTLPFDYQKSSVDIQKKKILSSISHHLKTPLNSTSILIEELKLAIKNDDLQEMIILPIDCNLKILTIKINQLNNYSRFLEDEFSPSISSFNIEELIKSVLNLIKCTSRLKKIDLVLEFDEFASKKINNDQNILKQILLDLLSNAYQYTYSGEIKVLCLNDDEENLAITVSDTGIGIDHQTMLYLNRKIKEDLSPKKVNFKLNQKENSKEINSPDLKFTERKLDEKDTLLNQKQINLEMVSDDVENENPEKFENKNYGLTLRMAFAFSKEINNERKALKIYSEENKGSSFTFFVSKKLKNEEIIASSLSDDSFEREKKIFWEKSFTVPLSKAGMLKRQNVYSSQDEILEKFSPSNALNVLIGSSESLNQSNNEGKIIKSKSLNGNSQSFSDHQRSGMTYIMDSKLKINPKYFISEENLNSNYIKERLELISSLMSKRSCQCHLVLAVDDAEMNLFALQTLLMRYKLQCDFARNGKEAVDSVIKKLKNECCKHYPLILMDLDMPIKNGYQATSEICQMIECPKFSTIVACTAYEGKEIDKAYNEGASDHLLKPVARHSLELVLVNWLGEEELTPKTKANVFNV